MGKFKIKNILLFIIAFCMMYSTLLNAAVVSDNDGAAFISKAEFDSLKNNFQTQIDSYNTSIDNKIDNAISSYLSGVVLKTDPDDLYKNLKNAMGVDLWVRNNIADTGNTTMKPELSINLVRRFYYTYYDNLICAWKFQGSWNTTRANAYVEAHMKARGNTQTNHNNALLSVGFQLTGKQDFDYGENDITALFPDSFVNEVWPQVTDDTGKCVYSMNKMNSTYNVLTKANQKIKNIVNKINNGEGKAWVFHEEPDGNLVLREFASTLYPIQTINLDVHTYKKFVTDNQSSLTADQLIAWYGTDNGLRDDTADNLLKVTIPQGVDYGTTDCGQTKVADDDTGSPQVWWEYTLAQLKATDLIDYSVSQWGMNTGNNIACIQDIQKTEVDTQETIARSETASTFPRMVYKPISNTLYEHDLKGVEVTYTKNKMIVYNKPLSSFVNTYISSVANETVYLGGGFPVAKPADKDQKLLVKIKFKAKDSNGNATTDVIHYQFSNKQFVNCNLAAGASDITNGVKNVTTGDEVELTIDGVDGLLWLNMYADTEGNQVAIDTFSVNQITT